MYYILFLLFACLFESLLAQDGLSWINTPPVFVQKGYQTRLQWSGGDGSPVTVILGTGYGEEFNNVTTIASDVTGVHSFDWTPSTSLPTASDYILELKQGDNALISLNFTIEGESSNNASTTASIVTGSTTTSTSTASRTSSSSASPIKTSGPRASTIPTPEPASSGISESAKYGIAGGIPAFVVSGLIISMIARYRRQQIQQSRKQDEDSKEEQTLYPQHTEIGTTNSETGALVGAVEEKGEVAGRKPELHGDHIPPYSLELEGSPSHQEGRWRELASP